MKVQVFLSDQRLEAVSVANQITEMAKPNFSPIDMRLPGRVVVQTLTFTRDGTHHGRGGASCLAAGGAATPDGG